MKVILFTHDHALLPIAHKLTLEGHEVDLFTWKPRFEKAWNGLLERTLPSKQWRVPNPGKGLKIDFNALKPTIEAAEGGAPVLIDFDWKEHPFEKAPNLFGVFPWNQTPNTVLRVGAWFDGKNLSCPHFLVADMGAWPGGMGASVLGGLTLIRSPFPENLDEVLVDDELAAAVFGEGGAFLNGGLEYWLQQHGFRGLVQIGLVQVREQVDGPLRFKLSGITAGWPFLHWHAFLSELPNLGDVLQGAEPVLPKKYVTVLPVTIPPWPGPSDRPAAEVPIEGLTPKRQGQVFWHDIRIQKDSKSLATGGLDGLVAVVPGAADTPSLSRAHALEVASQLAVPQRQLRVDVGSSLPAVLAHLEASYGWVL